MAAEVELRPVGPAEGGTLLALARAFHAEDGHPLTERGEAAVATVARGHPLVRAWLVEEETAAGREVVGYAALCLGFGIEHGGANASVDDLYLVPRARGRGLGAAVTRRLEAEARAIGIGTLFLVVDPENRPARRLYEREGFAATHWLTMVKLLDPA